MKRGCWFNHILSMKFNLKIDGLEGAKRDLRKFSDNVNKEMQKEIARTATTIHKEAREAAPVDTGVLRSKITFTVGNLAAVVWSGSKYAVDVEKGQRPGTWPDRNILQGWVKRKLGIGRKQLKGVTFLVARKIYRYGTDAQPYFEPTVVRNKTRFFNRVSRIMQRL